MNWTTDEEFEAALGNFIRGHRSSPRGVGDTWQRALAMSEDSRYVQLKQLPWVLLEDWGKRVE